MNKFFKDKENNKNSRITLYGFISLLVIYEIIILFFMIKN